MAKYYVKVPSTVIDDSNISLGAKGLLLFMLSKPKSWQFSQDSLSKQTGHGVDYIKARTKELKDAGLIKWNAPSRGNDGKYLKGNWEILCWDRSKTTRWF